MKNRMTIGTYEVFICRAVDPIGGVAQLPFTVVIKDGEAELIRHTAFGFNVMGVVEQLFRTELDIYTDEWLTDYLKGDLLKDGDVWSNGDKSDCFTRIGNTMFFKHSVGMPYSASYDSSHQYLCPA